MEGKRPPRCILVMGVSGCGKSTVAAALAERLGLRFVEADHWHSPQNVARMAAGTPLTDADRAAWLAQLSGLLAEAVRQQRGLVLACSALKRAYRDILREGAPDLWLLALHGDRTLLAQRLESRSGHYMPPSLLDSQLATLELPGADEPGVRLDLSAPVSDIVRQAMAALDGAPLPPPATHSREPFLNVFTKTILFTDTDGQARFRDEPVPLADGTPQSRLSAVFASGGYQLRHSPVGFRSQFHCTGAPQWVFILQGQMEIGLQGGASRVFGPGEHFYSADVLPEGATFDPLVHGHWSRQVGPDPLVTLFVRG